MYISIYYLPYTIITSGIVCFALIIFVTEVNNQYTFVDVLYINRSNNVCRKSQLLFLKNQITQKSHYNDLFRNSNIPTPGVLGSTILPEYKNNGLPYKLVG